MSSADNKGQQQKPSRVDAASNYYVNYDATNRRACSPLNRMHDRASQLVDQQRQSASTRQRELSSSITSHSSDNANYDLAHSEISRQNRPRRLSSDKKLTLVTGSNSVGNDSIDQRDSDLATPTTSTPTESDRKLVFGLHSRTNRVRHNEYAAGRSINNIASNHQINSSSSNNNDNIPKSCQSISTGHSHLTASEFDGRLEDNNKKMVATTSTPKTTTTKRHSSPRRKDSKAKSPSSSSTTIEASIPITTDGDSDEEMKENKAQIKPESDATSTEATQMAKPVKMQFNIPPPPPSKINSNKSSIVSYAKARIYDKQPPVISMSILPHQRGASSDSGLNDVDSASLTSPSSLNNLSKSIIAGFKPPKQTIDVRKAREKWEGGEPFAKCKSRQRLAATQAGKQVQLHNSWSMTSLVATQQLQFQQALAANASKGQKSFGSSSSLDDNMPVKILSRGSVLERVQKFESAPSMSELAEASLGVVDLADTADPVGSNENDKLKQLNGGANPKTCFVESPVAGLTTDQYLSTLHNARRKTLEELKANVADNTNGASQPKSPIITRDNGRRLSLRRRSSLNSLASKIPKFYHPNGKPNTYEIELQRRNIVACFDRFPDCKAALVGPNSRKNFHQVALACGFSEYFKEPLLLYVRHLEPTWSQERASHPMARKQSSFERSPSARRLSIVINPNNIHDAISTPLASPITPTTPTRTSIRPTLTRSASIDVTRSAENNQNQTEHGTGCAVQCDADSNQLSLKFITCDQYFVCWRHLIEYAYDNAARFIHLLTLGQRNYLVPDDFIPLIQSIIDDHPGLRFLGSAPDFHMRYIETVIARIYFNCNKSWTGKLSQTELRHSNLLTVLTRLSQTDDINEITDYFSYEHFYVIYCKFWSLDQDHDLKINKEDLIRHNDTSISSRIIERIFMGVVSRQIQETGQMGYSDFVWFLIAEEDKKHPRSIEYWFRLMDIDGDGYISMYEMEYFYVEQMKRLELMSIEALPFLDCACQMLDLVNPKEKNRITLSDLKRTKMVTIFYDTFINLDKYLEHESREFVSTRDVVMNGKIVSDWDRYASQEYENLASEDTSI